MSNRQSLNSSVKHMRLEMAKRRELIDEDMLAFAWVVDFPMFEYNDEEKRYVAMHHPFTAPRNEDLAMLATDPGKVYAKAYDMVLNGTEIGGGSIRIHRRDVQNEVFKAIGLTEEQAKEKFGFMMDAFEYGAPPHGGLAFGLAYPCNISQKRQIIRVRLCKKGLLRQSFFYSKLILVKVFYLKTNRL